MNEQTPANGAMVLVRMRGALPSLPAAEQRVAALIVDSPAGAANLSIKELADRCDTSTTSVVRLYRRMGYAHYKDLRIDLAREAARDEFTTSGLPDVSGDIDADDTLAEIIWKVALNETLSISDTARSLDLMSLETAVTRFGQARRIDIFGLGASSFAGWDFQQKLTRIGRTALSWSDPHSAWTAAATLDADCVALGVSHTGSTSEVVRFVEIAHDAGASTVALTNFAESALAARADTVLATAARETAFRSGALGSRIAQLMVIDCLFIGIAQSTYESSLAALRQTYAAVRGGAGSNVAD